MTNMIPHTRRCLPMPFITARLSGFKILYDKNAEFTGNACQIDISFGKVVFFSLRVCICVWIDLGVGASQRPHQMFVRIQQLTY